jgi:hypothetical protein
MPRRKMGLEGNLMKERISTVLTREGWLRRMLLLQMIMKGRRISTGMGWSRTRPEVTEMTQQVPIRIPLVGNHLLLC